LERYLNDSNAAKWFSGFELMEKNAGLYGILQATSKDRDEKTIQNICSFKGEERDVAEGGLTTNKLGWGCQWRSQLGCGYKKHGLPSIGHRG